MAKGLRSALVFDWTQARPWGIFLVSEQAAMRSLALEPMGGRTLALGFESRQPKLANRISPPLVESAAFHNRLSADEEQMLTHRNAARLLCWWRPAGPAPRLMRPWSCTSCHRTFMEARHQISIEKTSDRISHRKDRESNQPSKR